MSCGLPSPLPDRNSMKLFDLSICYRSHLPKIKKAIEDKYLSEAKEAGKSCADWKVSCAARKIIKKAYEEFGKVVKENYGRPDYDFFLDSSIRGQYSYFYGDLLERVEKIIEESRVSQA